MRRMRICATIAALSLAVVALLAAGSPAQAAEPVDGCRVYYPADTTINLATAQKDSDCWDSSMVSKEGRTFLGWSAEQLPDIMSGKEYNAVKSKIISRVTMAAPGKTVYAAWAVRPTLRYDVNVPDGVASPPATPGAVTVDFNTSAKDTSGWRIGDGSKIPGYTFQGWATAAHGGDLYDWNTPLTEPEVTVYARWELNTYRVRFNANAEDATGAMADQDFRYNVEQALRANAFSRPGWTFIGWNIQADGGGQAFRDRQPVKNLTSQSGGTVTLYAQWTHAPVKLRFDANQGEGVYDPIDGLAFETIAVPDDVDESFERAGYLLNGWNTQPDGKGQTYREGDDVTMGSSDMTLYAMWIPAITTVPETGGTGWVIPSWVGWTTAGGMVALLAAAGILLRGRRAHGNRPLVGGVGRGGA